MEIKHRQINNQGVFYIEQGGKWVGEMVYGVTSAKIMTIYHTEVSDVLKGQHAGMQLVKAGVEYARKHEMKVVPLCSFADAIISKDVGLQDVLAN